MATTVTFWKVMRLVVKKNDWNLIYKIFCHLYSFYHCEQLDNCPSSPWQKTRNFFSGKGGMERLWQKKKIVINGKDIVLNIVDNKWKITYRKWRFSQIFVQLVSQNTGSQTFTLHARLEETSPLNLSNLREKVTKR